MSKLFWRLLALFLTLIWGFIFISNLYLLAFENISNFVKVLDNIIYGICFVIFMILVIFPKYFILYAIVCCFLGIISLLKGTGIEAFLIYSLGYLFAYTHGVFLQKKYLIILFLLPPLVALIMQYQYGMVTILDSVIDLLFLCLFFAFSFFLLKESFTITRKRKIASVAVTLSCLTAEELTILKEVLDGKSFSTIGHEKYKSESSIKQIMSGVYKKLSIENKKELIELYEKDLLIFPG